MAAVVVLTTFSEIGIGISNMLVLTGLGAAFGVALRLRDAPLVVVPDEVGSTWNEAEVEATGKDGDGFWNTGMTSGTQQSRKSKKSRSVLSPPAGDGMLITLTGSSVCGVMLMTGFTSVMSSRKASYE
ncbi:hypothetical protein EGW08_007556 [Elysia chlorotica]|uniref:Uncharacterized protein n=1 Tax=Elysia chlorotica TaxID=188477 RepID=A0A3S1C704_ELYCH|nr:hypothetical protein EGW08_007556 [Elysia chlorotica]